MTPTTELSRADEAVKEPGKAWKNKWQVIDGDSFHEPGEIVFSERTYPSREIAEQNAQIGIKDNAAIAARSNRRPPEYLGPVEVAP